MLMVSIIYNFKVHLHIVSENIYFNIILLKHKPITYDTTRYDKIV